MNPAMSHGIGMSSTSSSSSSTAQQEYLLVGSITDSACEALLLRLKALCDNVETPETFRDHEMVFVLRGQNQQTAVLRARRSVNPPSSSWQLRYIGQNDVSDKSRMVTVRSYQDCATSKNLPGFLDEIGFKLDYEFVAEGHMFRKGRLKITVSKLFKFSQPGLPESSLDPMTNSRLVELSVVAPSGSENVPEDMRLFAEQLKPLVIVDKLHV
ncbi:mediator of RNA polymerase II transcription subunit 18-like [Lytechinus variegatus]|uniref:mediator of RNA polymerase II transcription subunit 18-like n=1 Tax=Lytechinus variegatus TaxID=7654 RepID=UPI001BB1534C|nr:mediator of RNA polymerase II transcription subunit 18-like [Lytechinus variegatus]XP_041471884.1 mediator of RNA polymerase II transcription subunit 18-like [Lytechinus variegatus]